MAQEKLKLNNQLCFRLYTASRLITQSYEPFFKPLGITYTQYLVLLVLWEEDNQPVNTIGQKLKLGVNTISPLIKRMESMGLLSRRDGTTDKRQQIVFLTQQGKDLEAKAAKIPACLSKELMECGIEPQTLLSIIAPLDQIIEKLSEHNKENVSKTKK